MEQLIGILLIIFSGLIQFAIGYSAGSLIQHGVLYFNGAGDKVYWPWQGLSSTTGFSKAVKIAEIVLMFVLFIITIITIAGQFIGFDLSYILQLEVLDWRVKAFLIGVGFIVGLIASIEKIVLGVILTWTLVVIPLSPIYGILWLIWKLFKLLGNLGVWSFIVGLVLIVLLLFFFGQGIWGFFN
jgi:hypothetical protein